jgi:hypothetical protein
MEIVLFFSGDRYSPASEYTSETGYITEKDMDIKKNSAIVLAGISIMAVG